MPRPLVYGNGHLLIAFDSGHQARDLFWPNVGYPNHLLGHMMRVGVWCDGEFSWCDSDDWDRELGYEPMSAVGRSTWRSWKLGLEILVTEAVHPVDPVFVRKLVVQDLRGVPRNVSVFFTQNFILGQSDVGNTAFYNPFCDAVIHYRGPFLAACTASTVDSGIDQYATGIKGFGGLEGTWRDAEDGVLSSNPIAQGSVDSTISARVSMPAQGSATVVFALALDQKLDQLGHTVEKHRKAGWEEVLTASAAESTEWLGSIHVSALEKLPAGVQALFWRSLLVIRSQVDHAGAVLAANDSDILETNRATYSYCWPRDGALVSTVLSKMGRPEFSERFVAFCARVMQDDQGHLMQKYRSDGSLGASWHPWVVEGTPVVPFQEDETALTLVALESCRLDIRKDLWNQIGRRWADFLLNHRDPSGLPLPSWDLWEERYGVHFFTACAVSAGLRSAAAIADSLGEDGKPYWYAAEKMKGLLSTRFFDHEAGRYSRMLKQSTTGWVHDTTPDSALLGGLLLLGLDSEEPWGSELDRLHADLNLSSESGGCARYWGDYYFRKSEDVPGNPWVISTMWFARHCAATGRLEKCMEALLRVSGWATESGILAEQYHPSTGTPLSVSPLTWSHAEFVECVLAYLEHSPQDRR